MPYKVFCPLVIKKKTTKLHLQMQQNFQLHILEGKNMINTIIINNMFYSKYQNRMTKIKTSNISEIPVTELLS